LYRNGSTGRMVERNLLQDLDDAIATIPGRLLIFIDYADGMIPKTALVDNRADIDSARVVWANDMGRKNRILMDYYPDRRVLFVTNFLSQANPNAQKVPAFQIREIHRRG